MVLLRPMLVVGVLFTVLVPSGVLSERGRRAGRRGGSSSGSDPGRPPPPAVEPVPDDPLLEAANSSSLSRSRRVKRQLVIPNGLTVGIIPRFDYTVFNGPNGEQLVVSVDVEIDYTFPQESSSERSALNRISRMLYDKQTIYSGMETLFTRFGLDGHACTLRAICEVGETPDHRDGLVGDFLSYMLSASYGVGERPELKSYWQAERYGRKYGSCASIFSSCPISIFSLVKDEDEEDFEGKEKEDREKRGKQRRPRTDRAQEFSENGEDVKGD